MPQASAAAVRALSLVPGTSRNRKRVEAERYRRSMRSGAKPSQEKIDELLKRLAKCRTERDQWRGVMQQAYELFLPQKNPYPENPAGSKKGAEVLDSTGQKAVRRWASRKQKQLLPASRQFAKYVPGIQIPNEMRDMASEYLEQQTEILFKHVNQSNASTEVHEAMLDASISTGVLMVRDGGEDKPLCFEAILPADVLIEEGPYGQIDNVYREKKCSAYKIMRQWPNFDFHADYAQELAKDPHKLEIQLVEGTVYNPSRGDYDYVVIDATKRHLGIHEVWEESPWIVFGASKLTGETYRRGPALTALADARTLQRVQELVLRNAAIAIAGLYKGKEDGILDPWNLVMQAGGVIPVAEMDSIEPLESGREFDVAQFIVADLQQSVLDAFGLMHLGNVEETPVRSASEVMIREQEAANDQFSEDSRLQGELVMQFVVKSTAVLVRRGLVDFKVDGKEVDVEFEGPIARAQNADELLQFSRAMELVAPLGPAAMMALKPEVAAKEVFVKSGVWRKAIRSDGEMRQMAEQAAQAARMMAQAQGMEMPEAAPQGAPQ